MPIWVIFGSRSTREALPDYLSIIVSNLLIVLSITLTFAGIQALRQVQVRGRLLCLVGFAVVARAFFHYTYIQPSLTARLLVIDAVSVVLLLLCVRALLKDAEDFLLLPLLATAFPFLLDVAISLLRFASTLRGLSPGSLFQGGLTFNLQFIAADLILVGTALGFTAIANRKLASHLEREALTDPLTQVFNRRAVESIAGRMLGHASRHGSPVPLLLIDLDNFKRVNDSFGHPAGDLALLQFAGLAKETLRQSDIFARLGGEEFVAVLPDTGRAKAHSTAERLRSAVDKNGFTLGGGPTRLTASIGLVTYPEDGADWSALLAKADAFLYQAKGAGRNSVFPPSA
jgi:diguanylate cyclase (GGDEF)-like protein